MIELIINLVLSVVSIVIIIWAIVEMVRGWRIRKEMFASMDESVERLVKSNQKMRELESKLHVDLLLDEIEHKNIRRQINERWGDA